MRAWRDRAARLLGWGVFLVLLGVIPLAVRQASSRPAPWRGRDSLAAPPGRGVWFLVRRYLPQFDAAVAWPYVLVGLGILLIVLALGRGGRSAD